MGIFNLSNQLSNFSENRGMQGGNNLIFSVPQANFTTFLPLKSKIALGSINLLLKNRKNAWKSAWRQLFEGIDK